MYDAKICVIFLINLFLFLMLVVTFQISAYNQTLVQSARQQDSQERL